MPFLEMGLLRLQEYVRRKGEAHGDWSRVTGVTTGSNEL